MLSYRRRKLSKRPVTKTTITAFEIKIQYSAQTQRNYMYSHRHLFKLMARPSKAWRASSSVLAFPSILLTQTRSQRLPERSAQSCNASTKYSTATNSQFILVWTMERLSTLEKANCNNVWSMKLDIFGDWMSYGEIGNFPLIFLYKSFKFSTYTVIQMHFRSWLRIFIIWIWKDNNSWSFLKKLKNDLIWPFDVVIWPWRLNAAMANGFV